MPKLEVIKTIEARKLHSRTRLALAEPPVTIPYGAILTDVTEKRDELEFHYLGELYICRADILRAASHSLDAAPPAPSSGASGAAAAAAPAHTFVWEKLNAAGPATSRAKLPGGWLIACDGRGLAFYPDPGHAWDGTTL